MAEQQQDVDSLKRRGRRRLVGAVALVLLAVIVLPMVFDPEPRTNVPPVSVRIPGEDESTFSPKGTKPAVKALEPRAVEPKAAPPKVVEEKPALVQKAEPAKPALAKGEFVVPVGAFANPDGVIARLAAANVPYYTEAAPGNLTRVRAGPFATRDAAEKAASRLKGLGLQPGAVATRTG
ncbi:SPOR domain-containing protein [Brevundimonas sp.]|uniref:SPOR domain-containing protein n=1 Tax=Brevundimonas sp. TaxID=1871086 RepID=UPI002D28B25F|nr:SPOR domain-containing protein [Brevundimonas sp.]HYC69416.1 SPOR domain-containing protein [Brevundimonas sp.]